MTYVSETGRLFLHYCHTPAAGIGIRNCRCCKGEDADGNRIINGRFRKYVFKNGSLYSTSGKKTLIMLPMGIMSGVGNVLSVAIMTVGMLFVESIGLLYLCVAVPFLLLAMFILITKVNETKGTDLSTVTGAEWD